MKKIGLVILVLVLLTAVAFLRNYFDNIKDDKSRLEHLASDFSILISEPKGNQQAANLTLGKSAIMITRSWCKSHVDQSGYGHKGVTIMYVHVYSPRYETHELYEPILKILGESPEQASWVFQHPDLRVRLLGFAAIEDHLRASSRPARAVSIAVDKSRLLESLGLLVQDKDPFLAGAVLWKLGKEKFFRAGILDKGFAHLCTEVRYASAKYAGRVQESLDAVELRELIGILIDHIDDRDGAVRGKCYSALGGAVFQLDCRLQRVKKERNATFPRELVKLPESPMGWDNLAIKSWNRAHEVKQMWQSWFDSLPEYGDISDK
jgi:hypothetical protein